MVRYRTFQLRSPRPPGEEDEGPDPVVDPVKNPELAKWAQENGMENLLEFTNETLSDHKNHILIESSIHEPSIFMSSADPTRFTFASAFAFVTSSLCWPAMPAFFFSRRVQQRHSRRSEFDEWRAQRQRRLQRGDLRVQQRQTRMSVNS